MSTHVCSGKRCLTGAIALMLGAGLQWASFGAQAQQGAEACGPVAIRGHYGPYDYVADQGRLEIVERFHFTPRVEALIAGESGYLGGDLSYTLDAFPNHHRALYSLLKWNLKTNSLKPPYLRISIECYFDRALRFRPKDTVARTFFAIYLAQIKRLDDAVHQLDMAAEYAGDNGVSQHNIGLAYLEFGKVEAALAQAHKARKLGYEGTMLMEKLKSANQWKEPTE